MGGWLPYSFCRVHPMRPSVATQERLDIARGAQEAFMEFESLFRHFWWLIFPFFGMFMGLIGMLGSMWRSRQAMGLIKSYVDQGKDPPAELLRIASGSEGAHGHPSATPGSGSSWSFVVFAAISIGFAVAYFNIPFPEGAFAFLVVSVVMGVMALGSLMMALFPRRPGE
jgi:hypothetical protein